MKILTCALLIFLFSCTPIHYLRKPLDLNPCIGASKRIIIAKDRMVCTKFNNKNANICIDALVSTLAKISAIEVSERVDFNQKVDTTSLLELKAEYNLDGLLLLTQITDFFVEKPIVSRLYCVECPAGHLLSYKLRISTCWEYFDFTTGDTYKYKVEIGTEGKRNSQNDEVIADLYQQLLFKNGLFSAQKLTGLEVQTPIIDSIKPPVSTSPFYRVPIQRNHRF